MSDGSAATPFDVGDVIGWLGARVLVLEAPRVKRGRLYARAVYLSEMTEGGNSGARRGQVQTDFLLEGKQHWPKPLDDDDAAYAMCWILIGRAP